MVVSFAFDLLALVSHRESECFTRSIECVLVLGEAAAAVVVVQLEGGIKICSETILLTLFHVLFSENGH